MENNQDLRTGGDTWTEQERYVLECVAAGKEANLMLKFGFEEKDREIRASFLGDLLTDSIPEFKPRRRGIRIRGAVIPGDLDLEQAQVRHPVMLWHCRFQGNVSLVDAHFQKNLSFFHSEFARKADFYRVRVEGEFSCEQATFEEEVSFQNADLRWRFDAAEAMFKSTNKANFNGMKVGETAFLADAEFRGPVDFGGADIKGQFAAQGAKFKSEELANFNGMIVGEDAIFTDAAFQGPVDFGGADIKGQFAAQGAKFESKEKANFSGMKVGDIAFFKDAEFQGPVDFSCADIKGQFAGQGAKFKSTDQADFSGMKVGGSAFFKDAEFQGPVNFGGADIKGQFDAQGAKFESKEKASFNGMKVGKDAFFPGAEFQGPVDFGSADIKGQFAAQGAKFVSQKKANFNGMQVGVAFFMGAEFHGPVDFAFMQVGINFEADGARFHFKDEAPPAPDQLPEVTARFMHVGQRSYFRNTLFAGKLSLAGSHFLDLLLSAPGLEELDLERATVHRELKIDATLKREGIPDREDMKIKALKCQNLQVLGPATLHRVKVIKSADLRDARCQRVKLLGVDWPSPGEGHSMCLDGLSYHAVTVRDHGEDQDGQQVPDPARDHQQAKEDCQKLLEWLGDSTFNTENYNQLEAYWQRCGNRYNADEVHIAGKKRELDSREPGLSKLATRIFWQGLTGFGRKAGRTLYAAMALIFLGIIFFTPPTLHKDNWLAQTSFYQAANAEAKAPAPGTQDPGRNPASYCPLPNCQNLALRGIISIDRLLPSWVDLGVARDWRPEGREISGWTLFYWNFHRVWGWILVAIGVAALSTRFK